MVWRGEGGGCCCEGGGLCEEVRYVTFQAKITLCLFVIEECKILSSKCHCPKLQCALISTSSLSLSLSLSEY